ncbi:ribonuclease R [Chitinophagaceae bacterium IBVUCB1]|nr:ribonuclease R [Chitinophagaceae bacterium IBVUCB1]
MSKKKKDGKSRLVYKGTLEITRAGRGFVIVDGLDKDISIRPEKLGNALHGDEVRVEVPEHGRKFGARPEGTIIEVIRRKQTEFSGRLQVKQHFAFLIPDSDKMPVDVYIPLDLLNNAKDGDHVMAKIVEWTAKSKNPVGEVISIMTHEAANDVAMKSILAENGFPLHFPDDVLEEAARYPEGVDSAEVKKRSDMRDTLTFTIDPVDAKDFDDAISYKPLNGGNFQLGVHIADVSHYIEAGSALDKEAFLRATSVYLPDRVLPMLPERLSNELCSLRPDEDKYTFSAIFEINKQGKVKDYWLGRTIIRSVRRYTYEEAQEIIEGADGDHKDVILLLNEMTQNLRKARFKKGAINFSSQEVRFKLDEKGKPIGITVKESKEAHQLIEECMLLANRTVAAYVSGIIVNNKPVPFPYRVHDAPDESKLSMFTVFAARFGYKFNIDSPEGIAASFNEMLRMVQGKPEQHVLESLGIRTMSKAVYTTDNIGHYGLGFQDYCHFTSPIRRYPDVMVHRVLQECLDNKVKPVKHMEAQCRHCSDQERRAMEAERAANKYKQVEYMQDYVGDEFEAVISGVSSFGFWAETVLHKCEGMVSLTDLRDIDDFEWQEGEYALVGRHTGLRLGMGDHVKVRVVSANLEKRQIDYMLAELPQNIHTSRSRNIHSAIHKTKTTKQTTKRKR